jgi:hypothetical protein
LAQAEQAEQAPIVVPRGGRPAMLATRLDVTLSGVWLAARRPWLGLNEPANVPSEVFTVASREN